MSESMIEIDKCGTARWNDINGKWHRLNGPAILYANGDTSWYVHGEFLGFDDEGFWALWDILTPEQKQDPTLLTYLPTAFSL